MHPNKEWSSDLIRSSIPLELKMSGLVNANVLKAILPFFIHFENLHMYLGVLNMDCFRYRKNSS